MGKPHILIVAGEPNRRDTLQFSLEAAGCETGTAADSSAALELYDDGLAWELVVVDEPPHGLDALAVLRQIRQRRPDAQVLVMVADATVERAVAAMKLGAADVLSQPCPPDQLRATVQQILSRPKPVRPLAPLPVSPAPPVLPPFSYVTQNGYQFWPVDLPPGGEETTALRIRRAFDVLAPDGELRRCCVDVTTSVRELVQAEARRELPPAAAVWDTVCKGALSEYLWQRGELPPAVLAVYDLNDRQQAAMRSVLGLTMRKRT